MVSDYQCVTSDRVAPSRKMGKRLWLYVLTRYQYLLTLFLGRITPGGVGGLQILETLTINELYQCYPPIPPPHTQTVQKVLARLKYPVPPYKARSRFSILTEECLTFRTISPVIGPNKTKRRALPCRPGSSCKPLSGVSCPAYPHSHCRIHIAKR